ncbi:hypothetical protein PULV_a3185 [Pseudoalteromonas ulvae UL12]|uniref:Agglutinin biogenesis protein MshI n=1 Tax=Pseudoalteromonas ulvae TaxID=107327 RepID=A0A244CQK4_PSEDV|nr:PilN domain-containing protein [Pseudoalteromonas ulvae]MBE0364898.1 hypothetical protein [Pseudoalteromonas ulvae UL12]OUL57469.1 hypothetical protein B1199_10350 [Pseudoalteromonas ulvae]
MKNRINLYTPELRPQKDPLSLVKLLVISGVVFSVMLVVSSIITTQVAQLKKALITEQYVAEQQQSSLNQLQAELEQKQNKSKLAQELKLIENEITHKKLMFDFISSRSEADAVYFANVMTDLARFHDNRIWLTEFKINPDNVTLAGMAENASVLPHWLDNLKQSDFFSGQSFSVMEFEQKNNTVMFTLAGLEKEAQP